MIAYFTLAQTREERMLPWHKMDEQGTLKRVLYDEIIPSPQPWLEAVDPKHTHLVNVWSEQGGKGEWLGASWVYFVFGTAAQIHFVIDRSHFHDAPTLGIQTCDFWFHWLRPCMPSCLCVWTPIPYRDVLKIILIWCFNIIGTSPGGCPMPTVEKKLRCKDAVISVLTYDNLMAAKAALEVR